MFAVPVCYRGSRFVAYAVSARKRLSVSFDISFLRTASVPAIPGAAHVSRCKRRGADIVFFIEAQKTLEVHKGCYASGLAISEHNCIAVGDLEGSIDVSNSGQNCSTTCVYT
jgi:hypothetical protein